MTTTDDHPDITVDGDALGDFDGPLYVGDTTVPLDADSHVAVTTLAEGVALVEVDGETVGVTDDVHIGGDQ